MMLSPSAALVTVVMLGDPTPSNMTDELKEIFGHESFAFCHDKGLALFPMEREYCEVVGKSNDLCPALPEVCKNDLPKDFKWTQRGRQRLGREGADYGPKDDRPDDGEETDGSGNGQRGDGKSGDSAGNGSGKDGKDGKGSGKDGKGSGKDGKGSGKDGKGGSGKDGKDADKESTSGKDEKPSDAASPPREEPSPPLEVPGWVAGFFRVLFYALVAGLVGLIGYYIFKNLMKGREDKEKPDDEPEDAGETRDAPVAARGPVETDVDRLLARARAAAQRGDFKQAIEDSYAALLRRLEGDGIIDLHPSRTNGDYVRSLRDKEDLRQAVRGIASDVEKVQFGSEAPNPTLFESVYRRVLPLCGRIATLAFLLLGVGSVSSCESMRAPTPLGDDVLLVGGSSVKKGGATGTGLAAVAEFLEKRDIDTTFVLSKDQSPKGGAKGIVLMPGAKVDRAQWKALRAWVKEEGGTLILAGHRSDVRDDFGIEYAPSAGPGVIKTVPGSVYEIYGHQIVLPYAAQLKGQPQRWETILVRGTESYAMLNGDYATSGGGRIVVFADDRLFANVAMALGDNASYLANLLSRCGVKDLEFWDSIRGSGGGEDGGANGSGEGSGSGSGSGEGEGADDPIESIKNARLLPIMLQLLALVLLFVLWKGTRFGTPRDPKEESRRAFADHTRALGMTYARANASRHASGLFSVWAIDRLRERLLGGTRGGLTPLAEAIAARTGRPMGEVMQVLLEATGARDEVAPPSSFRPGVAAHAPGPPTSGSARDFWIMEELSRYLAATKSAPKTRGRARR